MQKKVIILVHPLFPYDIAFDVVCTKDIEEEVRKSFSWLQRIHFCHYVEKLLKYSPELIYIGSEDTGHNAELLTDIIGRLLRSVVELARKFDVHIIVDKEAIK